MRKKTIAAVATGVLAVSLWAVPTAGAFNSLEHPSITAIQGVGQAAAAAAQKVG